MRDIFILLTTLFWTMTGVMCAWSQDTSGIPQKQNWSFSGPFGVYDKGQLQRGLQVYREVCASCHGLKFVAFRDLAALGYSNNDIRAFARTYEISDGVGSEGAMLTRPASLADYFPSPFVNTEQAALANNGAVPVDLSLIARGRRGARPPLAAIGDVFSPYTTAGPDYLYALLTGYAAAPLGEAIPEGRYYNPHFAADNAIAMAPPLYDDSIAYHDGTPQTVEHYARDVAAFLMWAADPHREERHKTGFRVIVFLLVFSSLAYLIKRRIWSQT